MNKKVLAVDDSVFVVEELRHTLQETDYEIVASCSSGEAALELYGTFLPDLVMMDIILPGMDGVEALRTLVKRWPDARVIVVSSLAFDDVIKQAVSAGACGFVGKPFDKKQLLETFNKAMEQD